MTRLYLVKTEGGDLIGWGPNDNAYLHKLEAGECIECDTQKARNPAHHAKFFALFDQAWRSQNKYPHTSAGKAALMIELKLKAGWYDEHVTASGQLVYVPRSISWARMGQDEFDVFYNEAIVALAEMFGTEQVVLEADEIIAKTGDSEVGSRAQASGF